ncbi:mas-related G-protein coupled receptor member H-like [Elgaria multicarinata webbii]|uniref:mas-related G-protein coupled receptor member H-like n=1 Tax=Elgaria multicarinata webbii TaxID=159646 RepID=UPI002FCD1EC8
MIIIAIPICIFGLLGNILIIAFVSWKIKKTRFTVYIQNVAAADLIVLLYQYTYFMLFLKPSPLSAPASHFLELMYVLGYNTSFYILAATCIERFLLVYFPIWYQHHQLKNFLAFCIMLWVFSGLVSLVEYSACNPRFYAYLKEDTFYCHATIILQMITEYLILIPIVVFCNLAVVCRNQKKGQQVRPAMLDITITAALFQFLIFDASIRLVRKIEHWFDSIDVPIFTTSVLLDSITSSINPYLYFLIGACHRKSCDPLEFLLKSALEDERNMVGGTQADQAQAQIYSEPQEPPNHS